MSNIFSAVQNTKVKSNTFDLTHDVKMSTEFGKLTPCCVMECMPGDSVNVSGNALVRLAPMLAPVMHRANVYIHYFFVPNRILWNNWEDFITGGREGTSNPTAPYISLGISGQPVGSLADYLGIPVGENLSALYNTDINALPFAAYQKIYNDYYRDQNFIAPVTDELVDGNNQPTITELTAVRNRAWEHDYFTSALPWTQRGVEVLLPLGTSADLVPKEDASGDVYQFFRQRASPHNPDNAWWNLGSPTDVAFQGNNTGDSGNFIPKPSGYVASPGYIAIEDSHQVDLSTATAATVIELRRALKLQEWLEKNARGGARYIEAIKVHFGVDSSDKRLQRAEYIGGFQSPIKFSEVLQTSETSGTPQANMAGHGVSVGGSKSYKYYAEEHGFLMGILSVLPRTAYQQGLPRMFTRTDKFDYPFPSFAHIGEQEILKQEVRMTNNSSDNTDVWGYTPRYAEWKYIPNRVAGQFRTTLDFWHMGRKWSSFPNLNQNFIEMNYQEVERIFAVPSAEEDHLWLQVLNVLKVGRKLPVFDNPRL